LSLSIFTATTPTEIYTLSLHDALPIYGQVFQQPKIHPTPNEAYWWNIEGGDRLTAIQTDCGPIGVLICYDAEFPELARHLADQGDRKSTRLNSSHVKISYAVFCLKKKK